MCAMEPKVEPAEQGGKRGYLNEEGRKETKKQRTKGRIRSRADDLVLSSSLLWSIASLRPVFCTRRTCRSLVDQIAHHQNCAGVERAVVESLRVVHLLPARRQDFLLVRLIL